MQNTNPFRCIKLQQGYHNKYYCNAVPLSFHCMNIPIYNTIALPINPSPWVVRFSTIQSPCFCNHLLGPGFCWKITRQTGPLFWGRASQVALSDTGIRPSFWGRVLGLFVHPVGSQQQTMTNQPGNRVPFRIAFDHSTFCSTAAVPLPDTALINWNLVLPRFKIPVISTLVELFTRSRACRVEPL